MPNNSAFSSFTKEQVSTIEAELQEFSYTFRYEDRAERFTFRTYKRASKSNYLDELDNLVRMYGDDHLMKQFVNTGALFNDRTGAERMRFNVLFKKVFGGK